MKLALINDTHAGARGDSAIFNEFFFKFWENVFFPYLEENNIKHVCHLGDVVDRRKFINYVTLNSWRKRFFDRLLKNNIQMDVIVGNHDVTYKNTNEINAMNELFEHYNNVNVYIDPVERVYDGVNVALVPWINSSNYQSSLEFLNNTKSQIVFGHFEISGFEMDRGNVCHEGLDRSKLDKYDVVLTGHFHHKSSDGHITYVGTPGEMTWADYNDPRGFHIFDTNTRELEFIKNPYRMFYKLNYDDSLEHFAEGYKSFDYSVYEGSFVKVVVVQKQNPFLFDIVIDKLYKAGACDISVVEDFTEVTLEEDQELIDEAEDTITILSKYIDNLTLNVESDKLKTLMRELYVEALNTETE